MIKNVICFGNIHLKKPKNLKQCQDRIMLHEIYWIEIQTSLVPDSLLIITSFAQVIMTNK